MAKLISIPDLMNNTNVGKFLSAVDLIKGERLINNVFFDEDNIIKRGKLIRYTFTVESETYYDEYYEVYIDMIDGEIVDTYCDCDAFKSHNSCKHIGACIMDNVGILFDKKQNKEDIANFLLEKFVNNKKLTIKKEVDVELKIDINDRYYWDSFLDPKIYIGIDKLYILNTKIGAFKKVYEDNEGEVKFGKNFIYNPDLYYFNEENKKIINAYIELSNGSNNRYYTDYEIKKFLSKIKDCHFIYKNYQINGINSGFPIKTKLSKSNDNYTLNFDINNIELVFNDDYDYI